MTTHTSGAADLPEAGCSKHHLIHCSQCRHDNMVRDLRAENDRLTTQLAALAAGQATAAQAQPAAQQGVAYAALPTSSYAGRVYEEGFLIGTCPLYTADKMRAFADATHALRASHGQAPAAPKGDIDE